MFVANRAETSIRTRVFHVPSHLAYVQQLTGERFTPVSALSGRPLRIADLLALQAWDWFDVLHLHTVELASRQDILAVADRVKRDAKHLVITVHDMRPNIESDSIEFAEKLRLALAAADRAVTLTEAARRDLLAAGLTSSPCEVVPHGPAFPNTVLQATPCGVGYGLAAFGALRPNRDFLRLVEAWRQLPRRSRPPLHLLLRGVTATDERREAAVLAALRETAEHHGDLTLDVRPDFVEPQVLAEWLRQSNLLVLPYRHVTHSGQLEAARDMGLSLLAPEVPTLQSQFPGGAQAAGYPVTWFPVEDLDDPVNFAAHIATAAKKTEAPKEVVAMFRSFREREHQRIVECHTRLYALDPLADGKIRP